jgi:hypothetical protein
MTGFQLPPSAKIVNVIGLAESTRKAESLAQFGKPIDTDDIKSLAGNGLTWPAHRASSCMGWVWRQWLLGTRSDVLSSTVEPFVARGLELRRLSRSYHKLPAHDLYLLHCAIFACSGQTVNTVAEQIADASGDKGETPLDFGYGELYLAAWTGMMKYWILGDQQKAVEQSELIWQAYRERGVTAAAKPLVTPWLKKDWAAFAKAQQKDFQKLWTRARKDRWTVKGETAMEITVTTERYQIEHEWCWAHCGLAMLAHRQGIKVETDPFWFPAAALASTTRDEKGHDAEPDQLRMF